jgi:DNA-binding NarL/FixJ family response regulator
MLAIGGRLGEDQRHFLIGHPEVSARMFVRIAVADPLPIFRRGVMAILRDAGFEPETPDDPLAWARDQDAKALIITLSSEADWELLGELHRSTAETLLVALLDRVTLEASVRAVRAGAACILPRDASPAVLSEAFRAVTNGQSLIGLDVLRALAAGEAPPAEEGPSFEERRWLRALSAGATVNRLAAEVGYSERMMFRLLRELYVRIGAQGRTDALIMAQAKGWL